MLYFCAKSKSKCIFTSGFPCRKSSRRLRRTTTYMKRSTQFEKNFAIIPIFGIFDINRIKMNKNTSISLGNYFDQFVQSSISEGRFKNVSEVIRAGLRLLEEEESKVIALKNAIQEGIDSGIAHDFDPKKHLESLKAKKHSNV